MPHLNDFFKGKLSVEKISAMDSKMRMEFLDRQIADHARREALSKNLEEALEDPGATLAILIQIEQRISPAFVIIEKEEKLEEELMADLGRLRSLDEIHSLGLDLAYEARKQAVLLTLLREIYEVLQAELHIIRLVRRNPRSAPRLFPHLYRLIYYNESKLYNSFREESYHDMAVYEKVRRLTKAMLFGENMEGIIETDGERFASEMRRIMSSPESNHEYRILARTMFSEIIRPVKFRIFSDPDYQVSNPADEENLHYGLETMIDDLDFLRGLVIKHRPGYNEAMVRTAIYAFRRAFHDRRLYPVIHG